MYSKLFFKNEPLQIIKKILGESILTEKEINEIEKYRDENDNFNLTSVKDFNKLKSLIKIVDKINNINSLDKDLEELEFEDILKTIEECSSYEEIKEKLISKHGFNKIDIEIETPSEKENINFENENIDKNYEKEIDIKYEYKDKTSNSTINDVKNDKNYSSLEEQEKLDNFIANNKEKWYKDFSLQNLQHKLDVIKYLEELGYTVTLKNKDKENYNDFISIEDLTYNENNKQIEIIYTDILYNYNNYQSNIKEVVENIVKTQFPNKEISTVPTKSSNIDTIVIVPNKYGEIRKCFINKKREKDIKIYIFDNKTFKLKELSYY